MDTRTGEIFKLTAEQLEKISEKERKFIFPIPSDQIESVTGMNRAQRRAWAKEEKSRLRREKRREGFNV